MQNNFPDLEKNGYKEVTLFISNMSEDVWSFIQAFDDYTVKTHEIVENANLSDQHLIGCSDERNLIFIAPQKIEDEFITYFKNLFGISHLLVLSPDKHTGETSIDLVKDGRLFDHVVSILKRYEKVNLKSYTSSYQFYALKNKLVELGLNVYTPEAPQDESAWTVNFFGSKAGIRQLAQISGIEEPDFQVPDGLICMGIFEASRIAANKYVKNHGVVLKTNKGHAGAGVLIFRDGDLPNDYHSCQKKLEYIMSQDSYWKLFPVVVEDYVNVNYKVGGGFPNTEYKIKGNGDIDLLYYGGLFVNDKGVFQGMEIGEDVFDDRFLATIIDFGYYIGEQYSKEGYRGYYDVDMIAGRNGKLYVSESNTRRTGSSHVYQAMAKLLDDDFVDNTYIITNNIHYRTNKTYIKFDELISKTHDILFNKIRNEGVIYSSANILTQNAVGYAIVSPTKKRTTEIYNTLCQRLELVR